jgi:hypothetical protein
MGLDNGIIVNKTGVEAVDVKLGKLASYIFPNGDYEFAYWRKCWNVRYIIFEVLQRGEDNGVVPDVTRDEVVKIIQCLKRINRYNFYDGPGCVWNWHEFKLIKRHSIARLKKLARMMKRHPEIEVYFYDSY